MKILLSMLLLVLMTNHSNVLFAQSMATGNSNSGDGVIIDGEAALRDLINDAELLTNNKGFIREVPGLMEMLTNLYKVHPKFALSIYDDLMSEEIWFLHGELPLFPDHYVPYIDHRERITFALRRTFEGDGAGDILISKYAYDRLDEQSKKCLFLHESLHKHRDGNRSEETAQMHHLYVRQMTRFICENNGIIDVSELNQMMERLRFLPDRVYNWPHLRSEVLAATQKFTQPEQLCSLFIANDSSVFIQETNNFYIEKIKNFFDLSTEECAPYLQESVARTVAFLKLQFPLFASDYELLREEDRVSDLPGVSSLPNFFSHEEANTQLRTVCAYGFEECLTHPFTSRKRYLLRRRREDSLRRRGVDYRRYDGPGLGPHYNQRRAERRHARAQRHLWEAIARKWNLTNSEIRQVCEAQFLSGEARRMVSVYLEQAQDEYQRLNDFLSQTDNFEAALADVYILQHPDIQEISESMNEELRRRISYCQRTQVVAQSHSSN